LDWHEQQGPGRAEYAVRKQRERVVRRSAHDGASVRQSAVLPEA
jgi:hypothetical protein